MKEMIECKAKERCYNPQKFHLIYMVNYLKCNERIIEHFGDVEGWEVAFPKGRGGGELLMMRYFGFPWCDIDRIKHLCVHISKLKG